MIEIKNDDNKVRKLASVKYEELTPPMQKFLQTFHPNIESWCSTEASTHNVNHPNSTIVPLKSWGPVHSYEQAILLKMISED